MKQNELEEKYNTVCSEYTDEQIKKLLHLNSVWNFIRYFDQIKPENKEEVYQKITDYLNLLKDSKSVFLTEKMESLYLFQEYIQPIGSIYRKDLSFGLTAPIWMKVVDVIIFCVLGYVVYYFLNTHILAILALLFLFWYGRKQFNRRRLGKFYQYQY